MSYVRDGSLVSGRLTSELMNIRLGVPRFGGSNHRVLCEKIKLIYARRPDKQRTIVQPKQARLSFSNVQITCSDDAVSDNKMTRKVTLSPKADLRARYMRDKSDAYLARRQNLLPSLSLWKD